ncbi:MAG: hypothetical protein AAGJ40_20195 [Planctomycetota bacterium]
MKRPQTPRRGRKLPALFLSIWTGLGVLSFVTDVSAPSLVNFVDETSYGCSEPIVVDGIWIRPCINSSKQGFTIPLLFSARWTGPPHSIGVSIVDDSDNDVDCRRVVIEQLVVTIDGKSNEILNVGETISADFKPYYPGTTNTMADAYVSVGDLIGTDCESPIVVTAILKIHSTDKIIHQSISGKFQRGGWREIWFIWQSMLPHALVVDLFNTDTWK